jgi:hypothetical protein
MRQVLAIAGLLATITAVPISCARAAEPAEDAAPTVRPCAHAGAPVNIPSEFPKTIPLPPATLITSAKSSEAGAVLIGFIPMGLEEATHFFMQRLPDAGFQLGRGEVEQHEAEARFGGNGVSGYFKVRSIPDCPGALDFTIRVKAISPPQSPGL